MTAEPSPVEPSAGSGSRLRVIWNPNAGSMAGLPTNTTSEAAIREVLRRCGLGDDVVAPSNEEQARVEVRRAVREGCQPIVAAGGDGTFDLVANELLDTGIPVGILPAGSAMNIARSLGIPRELDRAAEVLAAGFEREIDVGFARPLNPMSRFPARTFYEMVSVGLTAEILADAHDVEGGRFGSMLDLVRVLNRARPRRLRLRVDDDVLHVRAFMLAIANTPYTGLGLTLAPHALLDDGVLELRIYRRFSRFELLRHLASVAFGRRSWSPKVRELRAARVVIETPGLPCRADDFDLGASPLEVTLRPRALRVVAPAPEPAAAEPATDFGVPAGAFRTNGGAQSH